MPAKIVQITVEVLIDAVTCPGVWLCPEGEVSLAVFALGSSHHTSRVPPTFPLLYRDTFRFRKKFYNACLLSNLHCALKGETIYCELVQWRCSCEPCVLAQYLGSLSDVLFPPDTCASDGVDLLMRRTSAFPGILAPKIELSTKLRVDEVYDEDRSNSESPQTSPIGAASPDADIKRQKPVCHSRDYHRNRCIATCRSPKLRVKAIQTDRPRPEQQQGYVCTCTANAVCQHCKENSSSPATSSSVGLLPLSPLSPSSLQTPNNQSQSPNSSTPSPSSPAPSPDVLSNTQSTDPPAQNTYPPSPEPSSPSPQNMYSPASQDMYEASTPNAYLSQERTIASRDQNSVGNGEVSSRISDYLGEGRDRVARVLKSGDPGARWRRRSRSREGTRGGRGEAVAHTTEGPCVCDICRRYHQLFHVN